MKNQWELIQGPNIYINIEYAYMYICIYSQHQFLSIPEPDPWFINNHALMISEQNCPSVDCPDFMSAEIVCLLACSLLEKPDSGCLFAFPLAMSIFIFVRKNTCQPVSLGPIK